MSVKKSLLDSPMCRTTSTRFSFTWNSLWGCPCHRACLKNPTERHPGY